MNVHKITSTLRLIKSFTLLLSLLLITKLMTILVFCVGVFWIYDGIARGMTYFPLVGQSPVGMTVVKVENRNHRRLLPNYVATVSVSNAASTVDIPIFQDQFRRLRPGSSLEVHPLPSGGWLNHAKLDESMPILSLFGLHFSWHFPAGVLMLGGWFGLLPFLRRKQNRHAEQGAAGNSRRAGQSTVL
jgi:hypothetical protein